MYRSCAPPRGFGAEWLLWRRREPEPSKGPIPFHLLRSLARSFSEDHFVSDTGDVVFYQKDPNFWQKVRSTGAQIR